MKRNSAPVFIIILIAAVFLTNCLAVNTKADDGRHVKKHVKEVRNEFKAEVKETRLELQGLAEKTAGILKDARDFTAGHEESVKLPIPKEVVADITNPNGRACLYSFDGKNYVFYADGTKPPSEERKQRLIEACRADLAAKYQSK